MDGNHNLETLDDIRQKVNNLMSSRDRVVGVLRSSYGDDIDF